MTNRLIFPGCAAFALIAAFGQTPVPSLPPNFVPPATPNTAAIVKPARVAGVVLDDRFLTPLKRGYVALTPKFAGQIKSGETDLSGNFVIENVEPGDYTIEAHRDGYLDAHVAHRGGSRVPRILKIYSADDIRDLTFRLEPWGAVEGRVFFEDGEPAYGVRVVIYRKEYSRGRLQYLPKGSSRTDDRGTYRIPALPPGNYIVSAIYNKPVPAVTKDQPRLEVPGTELTYATTFYPSAQRLSQAVPIHLDSGGELTGIDVFLGSVRAVRVRIEVNDSCSGKLAAGSTVQLYSTDENNNPVVPFDADIDGTGGIFIIRALPPGQYLLLASGEPGPGCLGPLRARQILSVAGEPIDDFKITMNPAALALFDVAFDVTTDSNADIAAYGFHLESRSPLPGGNISLQTLKDKPGFFAAHVDSQEEYSFIPDRTPPDAYLQVPYTAKGSGPLHIGTHGSMFYGTVYNEKHEPVNGAAITLIPDPARGRFAAYSEAYSSEQGVFGFRGLAPGKYIAIPWLDVPPCDFYNWENIDACRRIGTSITFEESESKGLDLVLKLNN